MRLTCPACQAEMSLETAIGREADARALAQFIEQNVPLGALLVRYIALFRPAKRRLSLARTVALFEELLPDLQRQAVHRKGRDWAAPAEVWRAAIEQVLATRDKGTLSLPLTSHGYLYEVIVGAADKAEAVAEREAAQAARGRSQAGAVGSPVAAGAVVLQVADVRSDGSFAVQPAAALPPPYDPSKGPSRAAREMKAQMAAIRAARAAAAADVTAESEPTGGDAR